MKKAFRLSAVTAVASAALVTAAIPALAGTVKPAAVIANSQVLHQTGATINTGGSSFDKNLLNAATSAYQSLSPNNTQIKAYTSSSSGTGRAGVISNSLQIGFSDVPLMFAGNDAVSPGDYVQVPVALGGVAVIYNVNPASSFTASAGDFSLVSGKYAYTPGNGTNTGTAQTDTQAAGTTVNLDAACNALLAKYPVALDGVTLAKIFAGTITKWNNSLIVADNPKLAVKVAIPVSAAVAASTGVHAKVQKNGAAPINCLQNLTQENISVETRSAGSGTTFMFTDYLNQVDPTDFPTATQNAFASGTAAFTGSSTLAPAVAALDGSIGYVEYGFALQNGLTPARIKNATGAYVTLNAKSVAAAAADGLTAINAGTNGCTTKAFSMSTNAPAAADWAHAVKDSTTGNVTSSNVSGAPDVNTSCYSINNAPGAKDYPIAGFSYAITKGSTTVNATNTAIAKFLMYLSQIGGGSSADTTFGQNLAGSQAYVALPASVRTFAYNTLVNAFDTNAAGNPALPGAAGNLSVTN